MTDLNEVFAPQVTFPIAKFSVPDAVIEELKEQFADLEADTTKGYKVTRLRELHMFYPTKQKSIICLSVKNRCNL